MYRILKLLTDAEVAECRRIAESAPFVDGRITNPHNKTKVNEQLHDPQAYQKSSQLLLQAFGRSEEFREFAFPVLIAPPLLTRYHPGMHYGAHADAAYITLPGGVLRSDLSCTVYLTEPKDYDGGELHVRLGDADLKFKLQPGEAIIYPSDTLHQVVPVTTRRAAGCDHLHPEPNSGSVRAQHAVRIERGRRPGGAKDGPGEFQPPSTRPGEPAALLGRQALERYAAFLRCLRPSSSAICTALSAAPLRKLSLTTQRLRPFSTVGSSRIRLT